MTTDHIGHPPWDVITLAVQNTIDDGNRRDALAALTSVAHKYNRYFEALQKIERTEENSVPRVEGCTWAKNVARDALQE